MKYVNESHKKKLTAHSCKVDAAHDRVSPGPWIWNIRRIWLETRRGFHIQVDCPRSGPGPVRPLFADPGPGPQVQVQQFLDLDLDLYWTWTRVRSRSGPGPDLDMSTVV